MAGTLEYIYDQIEAWDGHPFDLMLELIQDLSYTQSLTEDFLEYILNYPKPMGNSEVKPKSITIDDLALYSYRYNSFLFEMVNALTRENPSKEVFYKQLKKNIFDSDFLPEDTIHQAFYLMVLVEQVNLLPYYEAENLLELEDEQYRDLIREIRPQIHKALHMNSRLFDTKTNKASQYWEIASTLKTREQQIVYWSVVLDIEKPEKKEETK